MYNLVAYSIQLAAETLGSSRDGLSDLMGRIGLFLLALLVFCGICGLAWRKLPSLRKIVPSPQMVLEMEAEEAAKAALNPVKPVRTINLAVIQEKAPKVEPVVTAPAVIEEEEPTDTIPEPAVASEIVLEQTVAPGDLALIGEGAAVHSNLEAAIADGRPGSVVKAASDINGLNSTSPIVIIKREE